MQIEKLPLDERIAQMKNGYYAHPEYVPAAIRSFAEIPIAVYLSEYPDKLDRLPGLLGMPKEKVRRMTYRDIANEIYHRWLENQRDLSMVEAIIILSLPFRNCYEERKNIYEKYQ